MTNGIKIIQMKITFLFQLRLKKKKESKHKD